MPNCCVCLEPIEIGAFNHFYKEIDGFICRNCVVKCAKFVLHIEEHLIDIAADTGKNGLKVVCKICRKNIDDINRGN